MYISRKNGINSKCMVEKKSYTFRFSYNNTVSSNVKK